MCRLLSKALYYTEVRTYRELAAGVRCCTAWIKASQEIFEYYRNSGARNLHGGLFNKPNRNHEKSESFAKRNNIKPVDTGVHAVCTTLRMSAADGYLQC